MGNRVLARPSQPGGMLRTRHSMQFVDAGQGGEPDLTALQQQSHYFCITRAGADDPTGLRAVR